MKTLYLDTFSGLSGDMFIGAMIDLGVDPHKFSDALGKLGLDEFHLQFSRQERGAVAGTKFDVHLAGAHGHEHSHGDSVHAHEHSHGHGSEHHDHLDGETHGPHGGPLLTLQAGRVELSVYETKVPPRFRLYFFDAHGHEAKPPAENDVTLETTRGAKKRQVFKFKKHGPYLEATAELPEPHEFEAVLKIKRGAKVERCEIEFVEDHDHGHCEHDHDHEHEHGHHHEHAGSQTSAPHEHGRNFTDIRALIEKSKLSKWVKEKSIAVFHRVAVAEGKIHGHPPEQVHFHEVGAVDSIVDIVGACVALEMLGKPRVLAASPIEGTGMIRCAHGNFPIPAPATLEILSTRGVTIQQCEEPGELITPTGAAILAEFVEDFGPMQQLRVEKIGYGLGTRQNQTRPNVVRAVLGAASNAPSREAGAALDWETDTVVVLETNLDDINAEWLGAFGEKAFAGGALDVFHTPVQMKKNRPGVLLTVLCASADADRFSEMILRETTAFGVRRTFAERRKLRREVVSVKTKFGEVAVKIGRLNNVVVQAAPEFESCRAAAEQRGASVRAVYDAALKALKL